MSASPTPSHVEMEADQVSGGSDVVLNRQLSREIDEIDSDRVGSTRDENINGEGSIALQATNTPDEDTHSVSSSKLETSPALPLGLSRRDGGYSSYDDYDVVTVHGIRDDIKTAWTSLADSNWIENWLFSFFNIRHLDYAYDNSDSARIYDSSGNGINMEANALLDSLARKRAVLPHTEQDRPIIWVCHDLGGSIVKQTLVNAIHNHPDPFEGQDENETSVDIRKVYRRLPLLTSAIIFLGCPHSSRSTEDMEDQLFALMSLPGPPVRTRMVQKISNLAHQIERTNLEFLESNVLDRAVVMNITLAPEQEMNDVAREPQTEQHMTAGENKADEQKTDHPTTLCRPFSTYTGLIFHNVESFYTLRLEKTDHLCLVRGSDPGESTPAHWAFHFRDFFNQKSGYVVRNSESFLGYQNSMLSLSPPTFVRMNTESSSTPALISWIMEHDLSIKEIDENLFPKTFYIHAGSKGCQAIDIKLVSRQLCMAFEKVKDPEKNSPIMGCFYFEFNRHDSRRNGIKAMITSFICTCACRFWEDGDQVLRWSESYLSMFKCWSLNDLITLFLSVQKNIAMLQQAIILSQFDQCDEKERLIFLKAILRRQCRSDLMCHLTITTSRRDDSICDILPPNRVINLDDGPSSQEHLAHPDHPGAAVARMQSLLARRPDLSLHGPELHHIFEKFSKFPILQDTVLEWLANSRHGISTDDAINVIRERSSNAHHNLLQDFINDLSVEKQQIILHTFNWIKHAEEPLTAEILAEAIRCRLPQEMTQLQLTRSHEEFSRFVEKTMRGIILRDGRDIIFSDDAFYETLATGELIDKQEQICRSHADIATVCLRYLLGEEGQKMLASLSVESQGMDDPTWSPMALPRHSLVSYALRFWAVHYQAAGDYRPLDLATELFNDKVRRDIWAEAVYVVSNPFTRSHKSYISPLPYMAMIGLDDLVRRQIEHEQRQDCANQDYWLAIAEAARNGNSTTVAILLEYADTDVADLGEALHLAANYGEGGALDCLISKAQQVQNFRWPPLILDRAVVAGLENLVSALVQADYDLNEESIFGTNRAVHTALEYGQDRVLKILLDSGRVDLGLENNEGRSLLVMTADWGTAESIRNLLDAGVGLDMSEESRIALLLDTITRPNPEALRTFIDAGVFSKTLIASEVNHGGIMTFPLSIAASSGFPECTRILLCHGADPNAVSQSGSALYQVIAERSFPEIYRMLLEKGANPNQSADDDPAYGGKDMLLNQAISTGSEKLVEMLLNHGAKFNVADPGRLQDDTPLSLAIKLDYARIAHLLLERGADPNLVSEDKVDCWSPLFTACWFRRDLTLIEDLLKRGANVQWTRSSDGWSVLHAAYDSPKLFIPLIQRGANINATDARNWTALMVAAGNNELESIKALLDLVVPKADLEVMSTDEVTETALHKACVGGKFEAVKLLLKAGADVNCQRNDDMFPLGIVLNSTDDWSWDADCEETVTLMLQQKPNLGLSDNMDNTVLHNIRKPWPVSVVMRLVDEGAPVNTVNHSGYSPLACAVEHGNFNVARYLTTLKGVRSDLYHPNFGSILHIAAAKCDLETVKQLVRTGAEHSVVDPVFGESVLYSAIGNSNDDERKRIIAYLVEELGADVNARGGKWGCPLMLTVAEHGSKSIEYYPWDSWQFEYLLRHGARADFVDSFGRTVTHWAALKLDSSAVNLLLGSGADPASVDKFGRTPLHFAASICDVDVMRSILSHLSLDANSFNINVQDIDGWTPLMWACKTDTADQALLLINEYKADICVRSNNGEWSPLKLARLHGWDDDVIERLVPQIDVQGHEKDRITQDRQTMPGKKHSPTCDGCSTTGQYYGQPCVGQTWGCVECDLDFDLCFKCIRHSEEMHDPEHRFVDLDEFEREQELHTLGECEAIDRAKEGSGSENEEQDEDDSESEEEEDDDSE